jgi:hypothetical protein
MICQKLTSRRQWPIPSAFGGDYASYVIFLESRRSIFLGLFVGDDQLTVDADFAELIDDHRDRCIRVAGQDAVQQRRLPRTEKTGQNSASNLRHDTLGRGDPARRDSSAVRLVKSYHANFMPARPVLADDGLRGDKVLDSLKEGAASRRRWG